SHSATHRDLRRLWPERLGFAGYHLDGLRSDLPPNPAWLGLAYRRDPRADRRAAYHVGHYRRVSGSALSHRQSQAANRRARCDAQRSGGAPRSAGDHHSRLTAQRGDKARDAQQAGRLLGKQTHILNASTEGQVDTAFAALARMRPDALLIGGDAFFPSRRAQLATLATRQGLPTIYNVREFATAGGLMSYGASLVDAYRQTGIYTGKILKGAKPAELPVMRPSKFELVI